jgi:ribosomal protein S3AE
MAVKKQWFEIAAPAFFGEKPIAETLAAEAKQIVGRVVSVSLSDLDPQAKKFWLKIDLRISDVQGSKAMTEIIGHDILTEKISRMVQRYSRRVDDIQDVVTTDGAKVRVKSVLTIPGSVGTSIKDAIRAKMHDTVK